MKMTGKAFLKKLFGAKYERVARTVFVDLLLFWGLYLADFRIRIAPSFLYLTAGAFSAGVMWQALSSEDNAAFMQNMMMLPFERKEFVFSYITAMGIYVFLTKTAAVLAVLFSVSAWSPAEVFEGILCAANGILMAAAIFSLERYRFVGSVWAAALIAVLFTGWDKPWFFPAISGNTLAALLLLQRADGYDFYLRENRRKRTAGRCGHHAVWIYFFRYLKSHKNYLANTAIMWGIACVLPSFFGRAESLSAVPVGFAVLSMNTPVCILLSCDRDLERAVRFLPGQGKAFCVPYGFFVFSCNMAADVFFLCSLEIQTGIVAPWMVAAAAFFALQSAAISVFLEWFFPIRSWKIESDLWHHPRKYIVPAIMLLLAGAVLELSWALRSILAVVSTGTAWRQLP